MFTVQAIADGFQIITPRGNVVWANDRPMVLKDRAYAEAKAAWLSAEPNEMLEPAQRRVLRKTLAARIGMSEASARGFFN
jgi:hypothetical protein